MAENDNLSAGLSLAGAVAPSVVNLISTLVSRFASDPQGTEAKVASVYDQIVALLGPESAAEGALKLARESAEEIARKLLAAKLAPQPELPPAIGPDPRVVAPPDNGPPPWLRDEPAPSPLTPPPTPEPAAEPSPAPPAPQPA